VGRVAREVQFIIDAGGIVRHLVDDDKTDLFDKLGTIQTTWRNSHVETWNSLDIDSKKWLVEHFPFGNDLPQFAGVDYRNSWWASMLPVGGPVLGPFQTHTQALEAERQWLITNNLPNRLP
jgi:hypothetical protein